jgi:aldose 1-epimerase
MSSPRGILTAVLIPLFLLGAAHASDAAGVERQAWGKTKGGEAVELYTLTNAKGHKVSIMTLGAIVVSIQVPDKAGALGDVALGFDSLDGYLAPNPFFGAVAGRYGNRIGGGTFTIDGHTSTLPKNDGANTLHGGTKGFDKYVWKGRPVTSSNGPTVVLTHVSPDGDQGFPGTLTATVTYTWTNDDELKIHYHATTDKPTVVNLTNHSYFNLAGAGSGTILGQVMQIFADKFTPVAKGLIPTGELKPVAGTPFDFLKPTPIGARIESSDEQITLGGGYDHNFVLNGSAGTLRPAAHVIDPSSGRTMDVLTTEPGVQFYTGNFLDGKITGKGGKVYAKRAGFCLETQHFPDSPNKPKFPSTVLRPGQRYDTTTVYRFGTEK